ITGTDIKQKIPSDAIATISDLTTIRDLLQGGMRERQLINGYQGIYFVTTSPVAKKIMSVMTGSEIVSNVNTTLNVDDIILYTEIKDMEKRTDSAFRSKNQEIGTYVKNLVFNKLLETLDISARQKIFKIFRKDILVKSVDDDNFMYETYVNGGGFKETQVALHDVVEKKLALVRSLQETARSLVDGGNIIDEDNLRRQLELMTVNPPPYDRAMPDKVYYVAGASGQLDKAVEVAQEQEQEQQQEQEQASQIHQNLELREEVPWDIDLNNSNDLALDSIEGLPGGSQVMPSLQLIMSKMPKLHVTINFAKTFKSKKSLHEKNSYRLLLVQDKRDSEASRANPFILVLVTQQEGKRIAAMLSTQVAANNFFACWLLSANGHLIQSGFEKFTANIYTNETFITNFALVSAIMLNPVFAEKGYVTPLIAWIEDNFKTNRDRKDVYTVLRDHYRQSFSKLSSSVAERLSTSPIVKNLLAGKISGQNVEGYADSEGVKNFDKIKKLLNQFKMVANKSVEEGGLGLNYLDENDARLKYFVAKLKKFLMNAKLYNNDDCNLHLLNYLPDANKAEASPALVMKSNSNEAFSMQWVDDDDVTGFEKLEIPQDKVGVVKALFDQNLNLITSKDAPFISISVGKYTCKSIAEAGGHLHPSLQDWFNLFVQKARTVIEQTNGAAGDSVAVSAFRRDLSYKILLKVILKQNLRVSSEDINNLNRSLFAMFAQHFNGMRYDFTNYRNRIKQYLLAQDNLVWDRDENSDGSIDAFIDDHLNEIKEWFATEKIKLVRKYVQDKLRESDDVGAENQLLVEKFPQEQSEDSFMTTVKTIAHEVDSRVIFADVTWRNREIAAGIAGSN
ncbi:MAG: hypothetical protein HQK53_05735, partial [Oligoflexia bacterium]|nr:hypothetical protein [Oligoflexia bacterium]